MSKLHERHFGETQNIVRANVRRFVDTHINPFIDEWEEANEFPRELYKLAGEAGLLGIGHDGEFGGAGGDVFTKIAASEELMRSSSGGLVASLGSIDIGLPPIARWGSNELKQRILPDVILGNKVIALAITEPSGGSDVANIKTTAKKDGDYYIVNGSKTFITSGHRADYYTVAVRTGGDGYGGISLLLIERDTEGFTRGKNLKKTGWWASDTAELFFDNCKVPASNLIGAENAGFLAIMSNFEMERLSLCVMANMTSELALDEALAYVKQREAFGRPIGKFQTIKHKLAEMATALEASKTFTYSLAQAISEGQPVIKEISMAKNLATQTSDKITYDAVQIFGGMGFMRESKVERLARDNRILSIGGGTYEIMNEVIAKQLGL
ncbi:acyl-CoA dehydrogenase [Oleiphilus sp. HI0009]|nr:MULTISPECIES: acyl-CoA dehydrogenase family protein [unclassified Oleiphilus]KZX77515.1 acyl-CoA dehydrogenase [Oleiphilus sp. HI0009]KZX77893.1 acyl-CoA dehydrogenase [Oleiphilus sp. HI0009]KZY65540.1 acyl-CoA dehydrogenase [Oleiphilus sp. HI0066]KZY67987.1 acyl-CoA dehydrogenase [Oleiphilus sp. HI0067]